VVLVFLCLTYFTWHKDVQFPPYWHKLQEYILWLNGIPVCVYTTFSSSIHCFFISWLLWIGYEKADACQHTSLYRQSNVFAWSYRSCLFNFVEEPHNFP
jgi:hypothetical protein